MCGPGRAFRHPVRIPLPRPAPAAEPVPGRSRFSKSRFHERDHGPRYRPGSGTSPAPGTADPGDHSTPAAAPLRIYPARSAGPGFRVSPSVRIPGNCACVRPPHRMPPPTRTANRIIGRSASPAAALPPRQPPHTYDAPPGPYPLRPLSLPPAGPASHTYGARSGSGPGPPHSPYSLRSVLSLFRLFRLFFPPSPPRVSLSVNIFHWKFVLSENKFYLCPVITYEQRRERMKKPDGGRTGPSDAHGRLRSESE